MEINVDAGTSVFEKIVRASCQFHGISRSEFFERKKTITLVRARWIAIALARHIGQYSIGTIAKKLDRDRTVIRNACFKTISAMSMIDLNKAAPIEQWVEAVDNNLPELSVYPNRHKPRPKNIKNYRWPPDKIQGFLNLKSRGFNRSEIGRMMNLSRDTIRNHWNKYEGMAQ